MGCFVPRRLCFDLHVSDCHCGINLLYWTWNMPARVSLINGIEGFFSYIVNMFLKQIVQQELKSFPFVSFFPQ